LHSLAKKFSVCDTTIKQILRGDSYKNIKWDVLKTTLLTGACYFIKEVGKSYLFIFLKKGMI
jgi:hypothetical protein